MPTPARINAGSRYRGCYDASSRAVGTASSITTSPSSAIPGVSPGIDGRRTASTPGAGTSPARPAATGIIASTAGTTSGGNDTRESAVISPTASASDSASPVADR